MVKRSAQGNGAGSGFELCECGGFGEDFNAHRRNDPKSFLSEDKKNWRLCGASQIVDKATSKYVCGFVFINYLAQNVLNLLI